MGRNSLQKQNEKNSVWRDLRLGDVHARRRRDHHQIRGAVVSLGGAALAVLTVGAALGFIFFIEKLSNDAFEQRMRHHFGDDWDR